MARRKRKCLNPACNCLLDASERFCSDFCEEEHEEAEEDEDYFECECDHENCEHESGPKARALPVPR